jgi:hypothetical protein
MWSMCSSARTFDHGSRSAASTAARSAAWHAPGQRAVTAPVQQTPPVDSKGSLSGAGERSPAVAGHGVPAETDPWAGADNGRESPGSALSVSQLGHGTAAGAEGHAIRCGGPRRTLLRIRTGNALGCKARCCFHKSTLPCVRPGVSHASHGKYGRVNLPPTVAASDETGGRRR